MENKKTILVLNGPNLQLLGKREVAVYGSETLEDIMEKMKVHAAAMQEDFELVFFQSCIEGELVRRIGDIVLGRNIDGIIFNPGAYTHTSVAILDALRALDGKVPVIEVHLSNVHAREDFRKNLITTQSANGIIAGFGSNSYVLALDALKNILKK